MEWQAREVGASLGVDVYDESGLALFTVACVYVASGFI
jgi:hypothetical protein